MWLGPPHGGQPTQDAERAGRSILTTREAGPGEQKALNLRANDQCALTTGDNRWKVGLDVVVEGRAARVTDDALLRVLAAMWATKYDGDWQYDVRDGAFHHEPGVAHVFEVRPCKLSFAKGDFAQTRFRFGG